MTMTDTTSTGTETLLQPAAAGAAAEFSEEQARKWLDTNHATSIRQLATLWRWNPTRVHRFVTRVRGETVRETPAETPAVLGETPETPETPSDGFDFERSEVILPARTTVFAYVDKDTGDLRIWGSDAAQQCDTELRINAEDVRDFINGLVELARDHGGAR